MELHQLSTDEKYMVDGYSGIAFWYAGPQLRWFDQIDSWDDDTMEETGMAIMVMVGDDREHIIDPADVTLIEGEVCSCGQTACGWDLQFS